MRVSSSAGCIVVVVVVVLNSSKIRARRLECNCDGTLRVSRCI